MWRATLLVLLALTLGGSVEVAAAKPWTPAEFNRQQARRSKQAMRQWVRQVYGKTGAGTGRLYHTKEGRRMRQLARQRLRAHQLGYAAVGARIPRPPAWLLK